MFQTHILRKAQAAPPFYPPSERQWTLVGLGRLDVDNWQLIITINLAIDQGDDRRAGRRLLHAPGVRQNTSRCHHHRLGLGRSHARRRISATTGVAADDDRRLGDGTPGGPDQGGDADNAALGQPQRQRQAQPRSRGSSRGESPAGSHAAPLAVREKLEDVGESLADWLAERDRRRRRRPPSYAVLHRLLKTQAKRRSATLSASARRRLVSCILDRDGHAKQRSQESRGWENFKSPIFQNPTNPRRACRQTSQECGAGATGNRATRAAPKPTDGCNNFSNGTRQVRECSGC